MQRIKGSLYVPAPSSGGGSGGSGPPVFLGPEPHTGEEDVYYAYSIQTQGTLPITLSVTAGALPTGTTLTGQNISGIPTNGAVYDFTVEATNADGSATHDFSILVDGTVPSLTYVTSQNSDFFFYPGTVGYYYYSRGASGGQIFISNTLTPTFSGSTPITFSSTGTLPSGITLNPTTGVISGTGAVSEVGNRRVFTSTATNLFGSSSWSFNVFGAALVYWGEWTGAVPGTFTASNITVDLTDDFGDVSPGPRRTNYNAFGLSWEIDGIPGSVQWFIEGSTTFYFLFPATVGAKTRVIAIPQGFFTGNMLNDDPPVAGPFTALIAAVDADADFTPAFPTPYQTGLSINGVPYDIFVITARDDQFALNWAGS